MKFDMENSNTMALNSGDFHNIQGIKKCHCKQTEKLKRLLDVWDRKVAKLRVSWMMVLLMMMMMMMMLMMMKKCLFLEEINTYSSAFPKFFV